jgi:serine/threonine protein kinase
MKPEPQQRPEDPSGSQVGQQYGPYRILSLLGVGGMGVVYRAHDARLGRDVAIKTLPTEFARDPERLARFRREARALGALNHPHIAGIYGLEESGGIALVMELVEGDDLARRIARGAIPFDEALPIAKQIAEALEAAHEHGIIHRDLKPANVKVTPQGRVKVLDFGLAKAISGTEGTPERPPAETVSDAGTMPWRILGTPGYMSPEQARGAAVDQRTDIWTFGCLLYELLAGKCAFKSATVSDTIAAVLEHEPDWQALPAGTPTKIRDLMRQCLQKEAAARVNSIAEARATLEDVQDGQKRWRFSAAQARQPRVAIPIAAMFLLLVFLGVRQYEHNSRVRWVREQAIPEISGLLDSTNFEAAFRLIRRAEAILPNDPTLKKIHHDSSFPTSFSTDPPGAEVWATGYSPDDNDWLYLGTTPFTTTELLWGFYRFRIVKPGFQTILATGQAIGGTVLGFDLDAEGALPPEMVRVPGGPVSVPGLGVAELSAFLIDRYEITNRQFKQFIDRGGYEKREYWKQDFVQSGRTLSWEEAMQVFRDATGRPGPSTWELGEYPQGHDDYPVNGVSWYEAVAYAEFAGKQLPTIYHWQKAASPGMFAAIVELSNFGGAGPARVGSHNGISAFGTQDMAGNVKEWSWNEFGGQRFINGGAWNQPLYMFSALDARPAWDRSAQNGIRCVRYDVSEEVGLRAPVTRPPTRDFSKEKPVSDEVFRLYRGLYAYDPTALDARVEGIDEENSHWKREKISFAAAYGNERVLGYLYIPKHATPPYQTILYADPGMSTRLPSPQPAQEHFFDFLVKSGRAFLLPVLKGQYQRRFADPPAGPNDYRDRLILESKDFRRAVDYLVSRPDVDRDRLGVFGFSRGANRLPILAVGEQRLKAAVLNSVGLSYANPPPLPEADMFNFLPRFRVPTLMVGPRSDFLFPVETSQRPMFELLGAPEEDKRLVLWDGGHGDTGPNFVGAIKEALDWFDRYLGPVKK